MRLWFIFALAILPAALAQEPNPAPPLIDNNTTTLTSQSTLVLVPALVRDKSKGGQLVFTLNVDDFALTDDGVPQKLLLEQDTGGEPLALVVDIEATAIHAATTASVR